ncbi:MAG: phenylalanine--tRNA ligase subunit beta [Paenibacillaceae bacterium]|nr:phenylalanine--tRNA ligase subunit beta [Paenibacillaceae bacterium]
MYSSWQHLARYVALDPCTPEQLAAQLTMAGIEVERVVHRPPVHGVVVGRVVAKNTHPKSTKLSVCTVDIGAKAHVTIVCGASNVDAGQYVPVACIGAHLPGGLVIRAVTLRGVRSDGMICSASELGLDDGPQEGIMVLSTEPTAELVLGMDVAALLGCGDVVFALSVTPNRTDAMHWIGLAREVSAVCTLPMRLTSFLDPTQLWASEVVHRDVPHHVEYTSSWWVEPTLPASKNIEKTTEAVRAYALIALHGVRVRPSPIWLQRRLIDSGMRPVHVIVDVLHYVMLELGQPMHAYDADALFGDRIVVRHAVCGERMTTLDGVDRVLDASDIVIADEQGPIALAGVIGGEHTKVTERTTRICIESAQCASDVVARMVHRHGVKTEASARFERGIAPQQAIAALQRAVQLITACQPDVVVCAMRRVGETIEAKQPIAMSIDDLCDVIGVPFSEHAVCASLERLGFDVAHTDVRSIRCTPPPWRMDVRLPIDVIEEVARLHIHDIPHTPVHGVQTAGHWTSAQRLRKTARAVLTAWGYDEAVTYSLVPLERPACIAPFVLDGATDVRVRMPMSSDHAVLRTSILPSLIETVAAHAARHERNTAFFEIASVYGKNDHIIEKVTIAALAMGQWGDAHWQGAHRIADFYAGKGVVEQLCIACGVSGIAFVPTEIEGYHPGRTARIVAYSDEQPFTLGRIGQLHPHVQAVYGLDDAIAFELDVDAMRACALSQSTYTPVSRFPASLRDIAVVSHTAVRADDLLRTIRKAGGDTLAVASIFDVYTGAPLSEEEKSTGVSLVFRHFGRTMTDMEVDHAVSCVVHALASEHGARIRER